MMMASGPTSLTLQVTGGDLTVTVKANVDGQDTEPVVFTFTQLVAPPVPTVVGSGDALMEGNMLDIPAGGSASVNVSLQNVASDSPECFVDGSHGHGGDRHADHSGCGRQ